MRPVYFPCWFNVEVVLRAVETDSFFGPWGFAAVWSFRCSGFT